MKFGLLPDGTLGYPAPVVQPPIPSFAHDNLPSVREWSLVVPAYDVQFTGNDVTHVDWFRATATGSDILFAVDALSDLLTHDDEGRLSWANEGIGG